MEAAVERFKALLITLTGMIGTLAWTEAGNVLVAALSAVIVVVLWKGRR
jgi:hypothetical protein